MAHTLLQEDPAAMLEIKEDIRDECAKVGSVTNVVLYDQEPDGVASVRYSTVEAAIACVKVCNSLYVNPSLPPFCLTPPENPNSISSLQKENVKPAPKFSLPPSTKLQPLKKTFLQVMNGRFFANKRVEAYIADGTERFKKSNEGKRAALILGIAPETGNGHGSRDDNGVSGGLLGDVDEEMDEEGRRLDRFGEWLEGGG